jgi:arabinofuranan 3-O-arabinosyltransferase
MTTTTDRKVRTGTPLPGTGPAQAPRAGDPIVAERVIRRMHLLAVSVALTVLAFVQTSGQIAPDTKADLSIDPMHFLLRAAHLWDPQGDSGQLQNQAYGYFVPMGPFYALGHALGIPAWVVQRAWWAVVLLVAFHGMYRLCERFGIANHPVQVIAGLAFALSPRMITEVGPVSIEAWPMAMAPWVLLPLVKVRPGGESGAAARSALAVALCGGVNAVAVGAVLPLPVWWLVTRHGGAVRRKLSAWWAFCVLLAIFWWLAPLLLLGQYSPPFLEWVESSAVSTSKGTLPSAFRGTSQWVAWFKLPEPLWPAGWSVLSSPVGILLGWLLIAIAVVGVLRRDAPHRRFLIGGALGGLILLTAGHTGSLTAPWAQTVQTFLDGLGAPLRNTSKFDVVIRIPLTLGLAHALTKVRLPAIALPGLPRLPAGSKPLRFIAVCALVGTAAPALVGQLPARGGFEKVPTPWRQAAKWLQANDDGARTLIVPGSSFATSIWGDPHDEPFQALARTNWATRSGVPLSSAGNIRVLNTIEQQLETGRGSPGLVEYLTRAGISRVLLRSDLVRSFQAGSPPLPVTVRAALQNSPGLTPVAAFGPVLKGVHDQEKVADDGLDVPQRQIEIWQIDAPARLADIERASDTLRVAGGPESLLTLAEAGVLGDRPTVLDGDPEAAALQKAPLIDTDTMQRREANFAQVRDNYSDVMTATQPYVAKRREHDWLPFAAPEVVARYEGISGTTASSQSGSSVSAWHAVDGDPSTSWTSSIYSVGQWLEVTFPVATSLPASIEVTPSPGGARIAEIRVTTDTGSETSSIGQETAAAQRLSVPGGATRTLRLTVTKVWPGEEFAPVSISELSLPGITARRTLVMPALAGVSAAPDTIALENARDGVDSCVFSHGRAVCSPRLARQSEDSDLERVAQLPAGATYTVQATARVKATDQADALLNRKDTMTATASSRQTDDPALRPGAALDRDPGTAWMASSSDARPTLSLSWPVKKTISRLRWQVDPALAASRPATLAIVANGKRQNVTPDASGWVSFLAVKTKQLQVVVTGVKPLMTLDRASGFETVLPVGASEIVIPQADAFRQAWRGYQGVRTACGTGTPLVIGDTVIRTRLSGTMDDVLRRQPMSVIPCDPVPALPTGSVRLALRANGLLEPQQLVFRRSGVTVPVPPATTAPVAVAQPSTEHRIITVDAASADQVLVVHENSNPGWRATLDGRQLATVRIDGWQQGWIVPAGLGGAIDLRFTPGNPYRLTLAIGLVLMLLLLLIASADRRVNRRLRREWRAARRGALSAELAAAETLGLVAPSAGSAVPGRSADPDGWAGTSGTADSTASARPGTGPADPDDLADPGGPAGPDGPVQPDGLAQPGGPVEHPRHAQFNGSADSARQELYRRELNRPVSPYALDRAEKVFAAPRPIQPATPPAGHDPAGHTLPTAQAHSNGPAHPDDPARAHAHDLPTTAWPPPEPTGVTGSVTLTEGRTLGLDSLLAVLAMVAIGGFWGLGVLAAVLLGVRRQLALRPLAAGFCALAGIGAAFSTNADKPGPIGVFSIFSALVVAACLVVGLDRAGGRILTRLADRIPPRVRERPGRRPLRLRVREAATRVWTATGPK